MELENWSKKRWRSLGKERPWELQWRRPWRNRISSGSVHIRWNLNGGVLAAAAAAAAIAAAAAELSSSSGDSSLGERKLGLGLEEEGSRSWWWGVLRLMGSLRGEDLVESGGGGCGVVGVESMALALALALGETKARARARCSLGASLVD